MRAVPPSNFHQGPLSSTYSVRPFPPYLMRPDLMTQITQPSPSTFIQQLSSRLICNGTVAQLIPVSCSGTNNLPFSSIVRSSLKPVEQVISDTK